MTRRERVQHAMHYQAVDKIPVRYYYCPVGYYEHGEKLNDLYATLPGDFEPFRRMPIPKLTAADFDENGKYHSFQTDEWGVTREFRIYGVQGIPNKYLLNSPEDVAAFNPPPFPPLDGPAFEAYRQQVLASKENDYFTFGGTGNLYERLIALYGDENTLCDIFNDEREINLLADKLTEYNLVHVKRAVNAGVDALAVGDDYGTERSLLMSPECWRSFFKPRWKEILKPAVEAGLDIHFHSCGMIKPILEDLAEIGVTSIWPQLPAYDMKELAEICRSLGLAIEIHTDRARTMTTGTPQEVRDLVKREIETFKMHEGGSWFYVEADNGFPFENIEALVQTISECR